MNEELEQTADSAATDGGPGRLKKNAASRLFTVEEVVDLLTETEEKLVDASPPADESSKEGFFIPGRSAAVVMCFFGIACLTALVLVATTERAEALSTIALALAVLAFVIQIVVFISQSVTSNRQMIQSEQLFTKTRALLTEVSTAARSTESLVREQFRDVLKAFLETQPGSKQEANFLAALRSELAASQTPPPRRVSTERPRGRVVSKQKQRLARKQFFEFPDEDTGAPVVRELERLDSRAINRLRVLAADLRLLTELNSLETLGEPLIPEDKPLEESGLTRTARINMDGDTYTVSQLTKKGVVAANLIMATGEVPSYAKDFAAKLNESD